MALIDRFREAWEDLRGTRKEEQETVSVRQSVADSEMQWAKDSKAALTPGERVEPVALVDRKSGEDLYLAAKSEVQPALQNVADEHYRGRLEAVPMTQETHVASQVAERTGYPVEVVRVAASDVLLDAYTQHIQGEAQRLNAAVGEKYSDEFAFREKQGEVWSFTHQATGQQIHLDAKGNFYDLEEGQSPKPITREEVVNRFQQIPADIEQRSAQQLMEDNKADLSSTHPAVSREYPLTPEERERIYAFNAVEVAVSRLAATEHNGRVDLISGGGEKQIVQEIIEESGLSRHIVQNALNKSLYDAQQSRWAEEEWRVLNAVGPQNAHNVEYSRETKNDVFTYTHAPTG